MSTPSSSAFVVTTPRTSPSRSPSSIAAALGRQVAAAVAADPRARPAVLAKRLAEAGEDELDRGPGAAEDDRLASGPQERKGPALGEREGRAPGTRGRVDHRRVHEAGGGARRRARRCGPRRAGGRPVRRVASSPGFAIVAEQVTMIGRRAVVRADPQEAPEHVRHVAAEEAAVGVQLVDDDDPDLLEQLEPLGVVGQDRGVEHVGVGDHDLAGGPDRRADGRRRVAVVGGRRDADAGRLGQSPGTRRPGPGRAPWSGRARAPARTGPRRAPGAPAARSTGSCPDAVGVTTQTSRPARTASSASAWCAYSDAMPRPASAARIRGSSQSGNGAVTASRAGSTAWWQHAARQRRLVEQPRQDGLDGRPGRTCAS